MDNTETKAFIKELKQQIHDKNCQISEMQMRNQKLIEKLKNLGLRCHDSARDLFEKDLCGCLHIVTADELTQKVDFPAEPIKVADMLNDKFTSVSGDYVRASVKNGYPIDETAFCDMRRQEVNMLRQIAEHLLVYCNNAEVE